MLEKKMVEIVKNVLRAYGKDLEKIVESYECIADFLIHRGVTVQDWISVKDRFPRKEECTAIAEDDAEYYVQLLIAYKTYIVEYEIGYYAGYK